LLFIFLNVLLTLELLHFVLKVEWDYQYRKFEENVVCWHHHVCHISEVPVEQFKIPKETSRESQNRYH
jgi:hypothetical protein